VSEIKIHPACDLFPPMPEEDFQELKANIAEHGVRDFVTFWKGQLVDGRHRVRAMQELGIDVMCHSSELYDDDDPFSFAISVNLKRRHLTTSQRAMIASKLATLLHGTNRFEEKVDARIQASTTTQEKAAQALNVGRTSIQEARKIERDAAPEVTAAVHAGTVTLNAAANLVKAEPDKQKQAAIVARGKQAVKEVVTAKKAEEQPKPPTPKPVESNVIGDVKALLKTAGANKLIRSRTQTLLTRIIESTPAERAIMRRILDAMDRDPDGTASKIELVREDEIT
jgi:ParB-like chromosome segregation protein Spo0J